MHGCPASPDRAAMVGDGAAAAHWLLEARCLLRERLHAM